MMRETGRDKERNKVGKRETTPKGERVAGRGRNGDEETRQGHCRWSFVGYGEWEEGEDEEERAASLSSLD